MAVVVAAMADVVVDVDTVLGIFRFKQVCAFLQKMVTAKQ